MKKQRRKHTAEFKARIALESIKGMDTVNEIGCCYKSIFYILVIVRGGTSHKRNPVP